MRLRSRSVPEAPCEAFFQDLVDETPAAIPPEPSIPIPTHAGPSSKGKGKLAQDAPSPDTPASAASDETSSPVSATCPITDKDVKPFPIMDLPTEIRLEIYRACLTRPYNILLSKQEQLTPALVGMDKPELDDIFEQRVIHEEHLPDDDPSTTTSSSILFRRASTSSLFRASARLPPPTIRFRVPRSDTTTTTTPTPSSTDDILITHHHTPGPRPPSRRHMLPLRTSFSSPSPPRPQTQDPLLVNILRASKQIYKEARGVLYSENLFSLDLNTALSTLACLHQRSRRQIKHVELEIPTYNEILERFQETVRLSLRYCSGLRSFVIHMPFMLPGADGTGTAGNSTVYANGFDILRWLPQGCNVSLKGFTCVEIERVVTKHLHLAKTLDKLAYARRQLISNDASSAPIVARVV